MPLGIHAIRSHYKWEKSLPSNKMAAQRGSITNSQEAILPFGGSQPSSKKVFTASALLLKLSLSRTATASAVALTPLCVV